MDWMSAKYQITYAANTRETVRRRVLHQFVQARLCDYNPDNPALPTNSMHAHYKLTGEAVAVIRSYGTAAWPVAVQTWDEESRRDSLGNRYLAC